MKKIELSTRIKTGLLLLAVLVKLPSFATTYTAAQSGNWSNSTTWTGGITPPFNVTSDAIVIPSGISVTMDSNANLSGALASIDVEGTLSSNTNQSLTVGNLASLTGAANGSINVSSLNLSGSPAVTFSGSMTVDTLLTSALSAQVTALISVVKVLKLSAGTLSVSTGGHISFGQNASIQLGGGLLAVNGGILNLASLYNVIYLPGALTTGLELSGPGLNNITVSAGAGNTVSLLSDVTVNGTLNLNSGSLAVGSNTLTINGNVTNAGGYINSSALSDISITTMGGTTGQLNFGDSSKVNALLINTGAGNKAHIGGNLLIADTLNIISGTLFLDSANFIVSGQIFGSGKLGSDSLSNVTVTSLTTLSFDTGSQQVNSLTINTGFGFGAVLTSNLNITGGLNLVGYSGLDISGDTINVEKNITGTIGTLICNSSTAININANANIIWPINFLGSSVGELNINIGANNVASAGRGINISNALNLQSGILDISGYSLALSGKASGSGTLTTNSLSNVAITSVGGTAGRLNFTSGSVLNNLLVNVGIGSSAQIGGSVNVSDTLALTSGTLDIGSANLNIGGVLTGTGGFSGNDSSNLTISSPTGLATNMNFVSGGQMLHNFIINIDSGSSVSFGTVLRIGGTLSLSNGSTLNIAQDSLILNGDMTGSGQLATNTGTTLIINTPASLSSILTVTAPVGTFALNTGSKDSVLLGSDLVTATMLNLDSGLLVLNGHNLTVNGNIANGNGTISSNSLSNVAVNTTGAITGGLGFTSGANVVNNFSIHATGSLVLQSNLSVDSNLTLSAGNINIGNDTLVVAASGHVNGGDSSSYVIAGGNGALGLYLNQGDTSWVKFAVGTSSSYSPVSLQLNTGSDGGVVYVSVNGEVLAQGTGGSNLSATNPLVNASWMVEPSFTSNVNINMMATWSSAIEVNSFNRDSAYISHYTAGAWDQNTFAAATVSGGTYFSMQRNHITSFSPFAVFGRGADTGTVAVQNITEDAGFAVYPNPATDNLIIKNTGNYDNMNIDIINTTGQVIASYKLTEYTTNVSLNALSAGTYFVKLYNNDMKVIKPFVKM